MKNILSIFFVLIALSVQGQNLVPNPDFSLSDTCPDNYSQITRCKYWYSANISTPDYFKPCGPTIINVPNNSMGYQDNRVHAYAGGYAIDKNFPIMRENIVTDIPTLAIGDTYKVTIRVSLANKSGIGCDGFGVYFYTFDRLEDTWRWLDSRIAQIDYSSYGIISDTTNWITMTKQFVADSAYNHICVGVMKPDSVLNTLTVSSSIQVAYYYYDSVAVEKVSGATGLTEIPININVVQYPNPVTSQCTLAINGEIEEGLTLNIFNSLGAIVRSMEVTSRITTIYREDLPVGIYSYKLCNKSGTIYNGKILMQ